MITVHCRVSTAIELEIEKTHSLLYPIPSLGNSVVVTVVNNIVAIAGDNCIFHFTSHFTLKLWSEIKMKIEIADHWKNSELPTTKQEKEGDYFFKKKWEIWKCTI